MPSWTPRSRATAAIDLPVSRTIRTAPSRNSRGLAVGDRVRIHALMKIETTPGGAVKTTYIAHAVYRLND
ncbi:hypothetical protein MSAS_39900 [Mycobacterium saskatchewanense]|uniref:Uncharacterized protein n=1 Tax=Mycobacterium intracellulare 1956 TaxID=1299331 RepID=X8CID9_MYCIT|nr:hypothetical protein I550_3996 [Mycobacterium intracellulare 1956]BBX64816.1 hypothetical protein MSAS_39900 [Mycobacterium saskatchewanense]